MTVKETNKKKPAVVVHYRPTQKYYRSRYPGLFLPPDRQIKFKLASLVLENSGFTVSSVYRMQPGHPPSITLVLFILTSEEDQPIHDVEIVLDKPGQLLMLIGEAKQSPNRRAQNDDLSVSVTDDWESLNAFYDFAFEDTEASREPVSGLLFYEYTETAQALLNDAIAGYTRLSFQERKKHQPDAALLDELEKNKKIALSLLRQPQTFSSIDRLQEVIEDYTPIVRSLLTYTSPLPTS